MLDLARLRGAANAMHRDRSGRLRAHHPFRRKLPKQTHPTALTAEYTVAIRRLTIDAIWRSIGPLLDALPRLAAGAIASTRHDGIVIVRADAGESDIAEAMLDRARSDVDTSLDRQRLVPIIQHVADDVARLQSGQLKGQLRASLGTDVSFRDRLVPEIERQFATENVQLIKGLADETLARIASRVARGLAAGHSAEEIAADLVAQKRIGERRAALVARDQLGKLQSRVNETRLRELGLDRFRWRISDAIPMKDHRPEHVRLDGKVFHFDRPPVIDGEPTLPGRAINCGCQAEPVLDGAPAEDEQG